MDLTRADWRKSSYSSTGANCVEVAGNLPAAVAIRDSKNPTAGTHIVHRHTWQGLLASIRRGHLVP